MGLVGIIMPTQKANVWISYVAEVSEFCFNLPGIVFIYCMNCAQPNRWRFINFNSRIIDGFASYESTVT